MLKLEVHVSLCHDLVNRKAKKVSLLRTPFPWFQMRHPPFLSHSWLRALMQIPLDRVTVYPDLSGTFLVSTSRPGVVINSLTFTLVQRITYMVTMSLGPGW